MVSHKIEAYGIIVPQFTLWSRRSKTSQHPRVWRFETFHRSGFNFITIKNRLRARITKRDWDMTIAALTRKIMWRRGKKNLNKKTINSASQRKSNQIEVHRQ